MNPVVGIDVEHDRDDPMAMQMVQDLCAAYPGHSWFVTIRGGVVFIKDMDIHPDWGMCIHYVDIKADAADRKKQVVRAAGEFLERAHKIAGKVRCEDVAAKVRAGWL
jgi:hypothetical protein